MQEKTMNPLLRLVMTGVLMALACVATMVIQIPSPTHGYMNLGDCVVLLSGCLLGPVYGAVAGGVGSALADLLSGYAVYVPGTLVIKAVMAALAGGLYRRSRKLLPVGAVLAELVMIVGYWLYDGFLMGSLAGSAAGIPSNIIQGLFGGVCGVALVAALSRVPQIRKWFPGL